MRKTSSICDVCLQKVPARTFLKQGKVFLEKECPQHGKFTAQHFWDDPEIYRELVNFSTLPAESANVVLAVTYRCNLHCPVCYANANKTKIEDLKMEEVFKNKKFREYQVVYLTGGEPTVREDLLAITKKLSRMGKKVILLSNGLKMSQKSYVLALKKAGLDSVVFQFDTLDDKNNLYIRGRKFLDIKRQAIKNAHLCGLPIRLQCVVLRGKNFKELKELINFALDQKVVKVLTFNPLWELGRHKKEDFVSSTEILLEVSRILNLTKSDWLESTKFLSNMEKILSLFSPRRRIFCKCNLKCLGFRNDGQFLSLGNFFALKTINRKLEKIYARKSKKEAIFWLLGFFLKDIPVNFVRNTVFRSLVFKFLGFSNPLLILSINIFPTKENLDFDFLAECNFNAVSSEDFNFDPSCLHRIKALEKKEK